MHKVKFGNSYWYVLKKDSEKILLCSRYEEKYLKLCDYSTSEDFFREVRRYMNVDFYDSKFSESDRKHILIVKNNYPYINYFTDELGYNRKRYEMKKEKDRVFPLKYDDVCNLSKRDLCDLCDSYESDYRLILLPSSINSNQNIPAIYYYEPWNNNQKYKECFEISNYKYEDIRGFDYEDYSFYCKPCIWVDLKANLVYEDR